MTATNATIKLANQKNGHKEVCINHEHNPDEINYGVRAIERRYCHIRKHTNNANTTLFTYFEDGKSSYITDQDIRDAVKMAARALDYEGTRGTPSTGYDDTQICKMGRWWSQAFREYIRENLSNYAEGMSKAMKKCHHFVNIDAGTYTDVSTICELDDNGNVLLQPAAVA